MRVSVKMDVWKRMEKRAKEKVHGRANATVQKKILQVTKDAIMVSPQWSGNYAFNWWPEYKGMEARWDRALKVEPWYSLRPNEKQAGDPAALQAAWPAITEVVKAIKWNHNVRLVNYAPVARLIEAGEVRLRPENMVHGNLGVITYLKTKYKFMR